MEVMDIELKTERLQIVIEPSVVERINDYRFENRIDSRSEAARRLLLSGLKAENEKADAAATASA